MGRAVSFPARPARMATDEDPPRDAEGSFGAQGVGARADPPAEGVPAPGDVLAGKYRVERVVGVGGMGVVVAAQHIALEERIALKFLQPGRHAPRHHRSLPPGGAIGRARSRASTWPA